MSCYLGPLGGLVDLSCPASLSRDTPGGMVYTTKRTVTGRALQFASVSRRAWALGSTNAAPEKLAALEAFASGGMGAGPFVFVPPDAPATNLVTPWDSLLFDAPHQLVNASVTPGWSGAGGRQLVDQDGKPVVVPGVASHHDPAQTGRVFLTTDPIPMPPGGGKVTLSGWAAQQGGAGVARLWAIAVDADGNNGANIAYTPSGGAALTRVSVTFDAPAGVPAIRVIGDGTGGMFAGVQVTWTDQVYPYVAGRGCTSAVLQTTGWDTILAVTGDPNWGRYDQANYVVAEAG